MSNGGLPSERLVNGENNIGAAAAATGAVSVRGGRGGVGGSSGGSISVGSGGGSNRRSSGGVGVGGGGGGAAAVIGASTSSNISSSSGSSSSTKSSNSGGNSSILAVAVAVTSGAVGTTSDFHDVTLFDVHGTPVNSFETIIPRTCCSSSFTIAGAPTDSGTTGRVGVGDNVATIDCREFKPARASSAGTTTPPDANSIVRIATAAAVVVDAAAPLFQDDGNGNMVAAMNEHLSSTTTTSSSAANSARTTATSSLASSAMTITTTIAGANNASTPSSTTMNTTMIGVNSNNARNQEFQEVDGDDGKAAAGILSFPCDFDHMYASMTDGGAPAVATATSALGVSPLRGNEPRQNDLTEVKHLKELLLLHLDLIQQQSEQIVTKDKLLAALRQENETLKLRLERMERRVNLQKLRSESNENSISSEHIGTCSPPIINSGNTPSTSELHRNIQSESTNNTPYNESFKIRLNTTGGITTVKQEPHDNQIKHETKQEANNEARFEWEEKKKRRSETTPLIANVKRKRGVSCSSMISNDTSSTVQDKIVSPTTHETNRKGDRKGKSLTKKESFLTTEEHYYTAVGEPSYTLSLKKSNPVETVNSLEVPNWRVKIYTSCYTMEGTENLDDEIFNKRHLKLENDERRRKRWDVQRIREQRHIEKLKQRQERQNHQATCYNTNHTGPCPSSMEEETVTSLWPDIEQVQGLQVDSHLPVTAFGASIPSFTPSGFSLPWSNITRLKCRRPKRSTGRRKLSRR